MQGKAIRNNLECKKCKFINDSNANFCVMCGIKLKQNCNCWIKKGPYNCGNAKCPSYKVYRQIIMDK